MASRKSKDAKSTDNEFQHANAIAIQVGRSDGTEMPSAYSQYERVEEGAKSIIDWQNKLGQSLAAELMPGTKEMFFLQDFPTHYHLRWYQAAKEDKKKPQAKHYYLFGYPEEPGASKARKYYRSPNQFLPHLLWLVGESQDRGDCACEFCSGSKPITSKSAKAKVVSAAGQAAPPAGTGINSPASTNNANTTTSTASTASTPKNAATNANGKTKSMNRASPIPQQPIVPQQSIVPQQPTVPQQPILTQRPVVAQQPKAPQQPTVHGARAVPPTQASEVALGVSQNPYPIAHDHDALFRAGEVVWFKNSNSWRVGMVLNAGSTLSIIPFGHPLYQTQEVIKEEADIRPFLAFSIPPINPKLQYLRGRALMQIDWQSLQQEFVAHADPTRREGLAIEATKLAATRVDQCYSTFNPIGEPAHNYEVFGGVFLGAEKICVGEAVRILLSHEQQDQAMEKGVPVVMVVKRIIISREGNALMFEGSLWKLQHATLEQQLQTPNQALPAALLREKEFRDSVLGGRGYRVEWMLMNQSMTANESAIRGRFYETRRLTPILNPAKFQDMLRQQRVEDIQTLLNNRGDSSGPYVGRVLNRAQSLAGAVAIPTPISPDVMEVSVQA